MPHRLIERIRQKILLRLYDMTVHAAEEMAEDGLDILDIEEAILNGRIVRRHKKDPRGIKYTIEGVALDGQKTGWCRGSISRNRSVFDYHSL